MDDVIVAGCNGFIGKKFAEYLLLKGCHVLGIDINNSINAPSFEFCRLEEMNNLENIHGKFDSMYIFSWIGVSSKDKNDYSKQFQNLRLVYDFLEFGKRIGIKHIIIPGSMSEFSKNNAPVIGNEQDSPSDIYALTKCLVRKMAYYFCINNSINLNWLFITSVYGAERNDSNLITSVIDDALRGNVVQTTKLEQIWDYIHISDLLNALFLVGCKGKANKSYPIGSGVAEPLSFYVKTILDCIGVQDVSGIGCLPYKNAYIDNSIPCIDDFVKDTNFSPKVSFKEGIKQMINERRRKLYGI